MEPATVRSLYGPKPDSCPAQYEQCGDCSIYPCLICKPVLVSAAGIQEFISIECSRRALAGTFKRPTLEHALMFLVTEVGEALDAYLRTPAGAEYVRNNEHRTDLTEELGDVVFMACVCANILGVDLDEQIRKKCEQIRKKCEQIRKKCERSRK